MLVRAEGSNREVHPITRFVVHVEARIVLEYGGLAVMKKDRIVWYWIGNHSEYHRLV